MLVDSQCLLNSSPRFSLFSLVVSVGGGKGWKLLSVIIHSGEGQSPREVQGDEAGMQGWRWAICLLQLQLSKFTHTHASVCFLLEVHWASWLLMSQSVSQSHLLVLYLWWSTYHFQFDIQKVSFGLSDVPVLGKLRFISCFIRLNLLAHNGLIVTKHTVCWWKCIDPSLFCSF